MAANVYFMQFSMLMASDEFCRNICEMAYWSFEKIYFRNALEAIQMVCSSGGGGGSAKNESILKLKFFISKRTRGRGVRN